MPFLPSICRKIPLFLPSICRKIPSICRKMTLVDPYYQVVTRAEILQNKILKKLQCVFFSFMVKNLVAFFQDFGIFQVEKKGRKKRQKKRKKKGGGVYTIVYK